ncbi:MAG: RNA polymerase sigma factor [Leptospiraceae bacterium]|nr:RNA polymerase sigma factor [Leptospiraceae bacterium]
MVVVKLDNQKIYELVQKCAEGNEEALKTFFELYAQDIYNFPIRIFHLTEDDAGDFFLFAFERLRNGKRFHSFQGKSSFKTWLYTVLRNLLIDWKRNRREVKTISTRKVNSDGVEYSGIEDEADTLSIEVQKAQEFSEIFQKILSEIKVENRVVFKMAFIYYLNLDEEEINHITQKTGISREELKQKILKIREMLSEKAMENIEYENKITSLYLQILELKETQKRESYHKFEDNLPYRDKIETAIQKKYEQRKRLLEKKNKGLFLTRTPFKIISETLQIPEGSISITIQRVVEKIKKKLEEFEI